MALVFYAGHGLEMSGENYLVPVDAALATASAVERETVALRSVLNATLGARTRIVILDACRNNPFVRSMRGARSRNVRSGGLAAVAQGEGLLVAYAAAAGELAADGKGQRNSPYTAALLRHIDTPGVDVRVMLGDVGGAVQAATGGQTPFIYSSLTGQHHLGSETIQSGPGYDVVSSGLREQENLFWQSIQANPSAAKYGAYLSQYPNGAFAALARLAAVELGGGGVDAPRPSVVSDAVVNRWQAPGMQETGMSGIVVDDTGGVLPGVTVAVSGRPLTAGSRSDFTDGAGRYAIDPLPRGTYAITFTLPGFATAVVEDVRVVSGVRVTVDATLRATGARRPW